MRELVVVSGKGGTGKTSVTASLALLAAGRVAGMDMAAAAWPGGPVTADCDVDAADLHLLLAPEVEQRHDFTSGHEAVIDPDLCDGCGVCAEVCRFEAIVEVDGGYPGGPAGAPDGPPADAPARVRCAGTLAVDPLACEGCGVCVRLCPRQAIAFPERHCGQWMVSTARSGPMVHARLAAAAENSGKLVSTVRHQARELATATGRDLVVVDGPPGIGCPVIAAVTGASLVLAVTEPTVSGAHDLERVLALARHFGIPAAVCVNKWDLAPEVADRIEQAAIARGARALPRIRYDRGVTDAQRDARAVVEIDTPAAADVRRLWTDLAPLLRGDDSP
jgi:MinD superfamily P-loop ATPase